MAQENLGSMDDDFADFKTPSSTSTIISIITSPIPSTGGEATSVSSPTAVSPGQPNYWPPGSPWYAIWERHSAREFIVEFWIVGILIAVLIAHYLGLRKNRSLARQWVRQHFSVLEREFAMVATDRKGRPNTLETETLSGPTDPSSLVVEKSPTEFMLYASGRANIAFARINLNFKKRNNPIALLAEYLLSFTLDNFATPIDSVTITLYPFDGEERNLLGSAASIGKLNDSRYDNFIWSIVYKQSMRLLREQRYDLSLTRTSDWPEKIPRWLSVMAEAKEIGDHIFTKDLEEEIKNLPEGALDYLIISDQPIVKPTIPSETASKKRISMKLNLSVVPPSATVSLLQAFIRLVDHLTTTRPLHPNSLRKVQATRDEQVKLLQKVKEEELAGERDQKRAEEKKKEREKKLRGMSAEEQKKFLEKEKDKEMRKSLKKSAKKM